MEELQVENDELRRQLEEARSSACITMSKAATFSPSGQSFTISGLEELVLIANAENKINFINSKMAALLGFKSRKEALGASLQNWDQGSLGDGFLIALAEAARNSGQTCVLERNVRGLPECALSSAANQCRREEVTLRFVVTPSQQNVQVIIQDITHIRWLERSFSRYVSPRVIELLRGMSEAEIMKVKRTSVTVLFADLRGFTTVCQEMEAEEVCNMVNEFLANMVARIEKYDGTVDKFMGDEVMAIFGAPLATEDHALRALLAAQEMAQGHLAWRQERLARNMVAPEVGIGIATGEVVIGNIGTPERMEYTALGHTVNLASRLCGKAVGGEILIIKSTYDGAAQAFKNWRGPGSIPRFRFEKREKIEFRNMKQTMNVWAVALD